ncbi:MAG TPA: four helix bundle protein [Chitinophagales bacterium]|nr:four helix bundle protein [Chitinophagales bacterium]
MNPEDLKRRTKAFAARIIKMVRALPKDIVGREIGKQELRSGTSVAANYRSACRARSDADFIYKIKVAEEESDETQLWLELIVDIELLPAKRISSLLKEASELTAMLTASGKTSRINKQVRKR